MDFSNLTAKYLSGNASDAEVQALEAWVLAASENRQQFQAFKKAWMLTGMAQDSQTVDVDALWKQTNEQLPEAAKSVSMKPRQSRRRWWSVAAAIALLAVASFVLFQVLSGESPTMLATTSAAQSFDLPDGSAIVLNQASSLSLAFKKGSERRAVSLKGDAFFDVARDETSPFIIQAENIDIEVLGTSFYVDARESASDIQVIVESGQVAVRAGASEVVLAAGEKAVFQKSTQQLSRTPNDDINFLALITKVLVFENVTLDEVVFDLNRQFNTRIRLDNEVLKNCQLNATFNDKSLDAILTILENTLGIEIQRNGKEIVLQGECE